MNVLPRKHERSETEGPSLLQGCAVLALLTTMTSPIPCTASERTSDSRPYIFPYPGNTRTAQGLPRFSTFLSYVPSLLRRGMNESHLPVGSSHSGSLRLKTRDSASPVPRYFWYDLHGATSGFLIVRPAFCVVPYRTFVEWLHEIGLPPSHALLATWLNRQLPWWVSRPQERRPSWHTIILVRLFPRVLDDAKLVRVQHIAGSPSLLDSIRPPERSRGSLQDHGVLGAELLDVLP
jgi:hypothetical protein